MTRPRRRRRAHAVVLVVLAAAVVSAGCGVTGREAVGGPASPSVDVPAEVRGFRSVRTVAPEPLPRRLRIPALGVDTRLERLGRDADTVEVPRDWQRAGWYREGPRPGGPGSAVILGHVDSPQGPAVFRGLAGLRPGTRVLVERADGSTVTFRVTRVAAFPRARLPVQQVYWPTVARELRLITCGGRYDRAAGGYQSNVVVFATAEPRGLGY